MGEVHTTAKAGDDHVRSGAGAPITPQRRTFGELLTSDLRALPVIIGLVVLWVFFTFQSDVFLSARNISNLLLQSTVVGIMAFGIMFVLLVREIDLSIAAINGITAVLMAKFIVEFGFSPWIAIPLSILVGVLIGMASARWVTFVGVPSFVVTLGLGLALNGVQLLLLPDTARYGLMNTGVEVIAQAKVAGAWAWVVFAIFLGIGAALVLSSAQRRRKNGLNVPVMSSVVLPLAGSAAFGAIIILVMNAHQGIPLPTLIFAVLLIVGGYVLKETTFGLSLYAVGNNDEAATARRYSGGCSQDGGLRDSWWSSGAGRHHCGVPDARCWRLQWRWGRWRNAAAGVDSGGRDRRRQPLWWSRSDLFGPFGGTGDRNRAKWPKPDGC
jgi:D-xylose transport system permease protein